MAKDDEVMTTEKFLNLWNDKNRPRSIVIQQKEGNCLTVVINFPPDVVAVGKMDLCMDPLLCDPI